jgi:hypothetical protein
MTGREKKQKLWSIQRSVAACTPSRRSEDGFFNFPTELRQGSSAWAPPEEDRTDDHISGGSSEPVVTGVCGVRSSKEEKSIGDVLLALLSRPALAVRERSELGRGR